MKSVTQRGNARTSEAKKAKTVTPVTMPPPSGVRSRESTDAETLSAIEANRAWKATNEETRLRLGEKQREAERPAFRRFLDVPYDARPTTLMDLIADAIGDRDAGDLEGSFLDAVHDDLMTIFYAISDEGEFVRGDFDLAMLPTMLWRLATRAKAVREIAFRQRSAERLSKVSA